MLVTVFCKGSYDFVNNDWRWLSWVSQGVHLVYSWLSVAHWPPRVPSLLCFATPHWGAADTEIKAPLCTADNPELSKALSLVLTHAIILCLLSKYDGGEMKLTEPESQKLAWERSWSEASYAPFWSDYPGFSAEVLHPQGCNRHTLPNNAILLPRMFSFYIWNWICMTVKNEVDWTRKSEIRRREVMARAIVCTSMIWPPCGF